MAASGAVEARQKILGVAMAEEMGIGLRCDGPFQETAGFTGHSARTVSVRLAGCLGSR